MENYNEMYHHGVKGMRWGVRRYQNKDGTMTAYGKKRYAREMSKLAEQEKILKNRQKTAAKMAKLDKKKQEIEELKKKNEPDKDAKSKKPASTQPQQPVKKTVKDMTDDELRTKIARLKLEEEYTNLSKKSCNDVSTTNSEKSKKGKTFAKKYLGEAGKRILWDTSVDLASQTAKHLLAKQINSSLGAKNSSGDPIDAVFSNNKRK